MPTSRRGNKARWLKKQLLTQPEKFREQGRTGIVKKAVRSFIFDKMGSCPQQVKAENIVAFARTNKKKGITPYETIWAFSRHVVFDSELSRAGRIMSLDSKRVDEAIKKGRKKELF